MLTEEPAIRIFIRLEFVMLIERTLWSVEKTDKQRQDGKNGKTHERRTR